MTVEAAVAAPRKKGEASCLTETAVDGGKRRTAMLPFAEALAKSNKEGNDIGSCNVRTRDI